MNWRRFLILMGFVLTVTVILWGFDQGRAQQATKGNSPTLQTPGKSPNPQGQAVEKAAAQRASYGLQRSVTNAQREAAAARAAVRRAEAARAATLPPAERGGAK